MIVAYVSTAVACTLLGLVAFGMTGNVDAR